MPEAALPHILEPDLTRTDASGPAAPSTAPEPAVPAVSVAAFEQLGLGGRTLLLVGSSGGHLDELLKIADLIGVDPDSLVVTFDTAQAATLHETRNVEFVRYVKPRDLRGALATYPRFRALVATGRFEAVLSTGAAVALPALAAATRAGVRGIYVESYARFEGSSTTGKLLRFLPRIETYTQHVGWSGDRWPYVGSIRAAFPPRRQVQSQHAADRPMRLLVTVGTIRPYRFDALVEGVLRAMPDDAEVIWQLGATMRDDLPGEVHEVMPYDVFLRAAERADVVISHAGVGTAMTLAQMGKPTILVPRRASRDEHVDNHQVQICEDLAADGLVLHREAETLSREDLTSAVYAG